MKRISLGLSFVLFVLLCATGSFWLLQFMKPETRKISAPPTVRPSADVASVAALFGGALALNTNYQLRGIVLANPASQSEAIIAVDGKPAAAFTVHSEINPGVKLSDVHAGYILILENGVSRRVDLPQDAKAVNPPGAVGAAPVRSAPGPNLASPPNGIQPVPNPPAP